MLSALYRRLTAPQRLDIQAIGMAARDAAGQWSELNDGDFVCQADHLRAAWIKEKPADLSLPTAIAIEAIRRRLAITPYDVQIRAGLVMSTGMIAEMQTGEGKTVAGALSAMVHAIQSRHVHVATANEYLAQRDWQLLTPVFELVGLTTGHSSSQQTISQKQASYQSDVVFATGHQFGFDYLRDQMTLRNRPRLRLGETMRNQLAGITNERDGLCQRGHDVAIIDEVDSVLLDEAMTPLVLSGAETPHRVGEKADAVNRDANGEAYELAAQCADELETGVDYLVDPIRSRIQLQSSGSRHAMEFLRDHPGASLMMPWTEYLQATLRAKHLLRRDVDYVVREGQVQIVDAATGRIAADRQWRGGLHQAVETREAVERTSPRRTMCRISRQRYFGKYELLSGMTGTASGHESEWKRAYGLAIEPIPTRLPSQRSELPTIYTATATQKLACLVDEVVRCHSTGQPILIGTRTIEQSKLVAKALMVAGINHRLLNGVQDEAEAELVAAAGKCGSVTVATNMAGRGTDIAINHDAIQAGGLHVVALERNLCSRLDRQLAGRAARQGQPGSARFLVSGEDELVARYDEGLRKKLARLSGPQSNPVWDERIHALQSIGDREADETRQNTANQEEWLDELRKHVA